ncbi:MAG: hypothetical protein ACREQ7_17420 [Candidatus Binatia bacterium]
MDWLLIFAGATIGLLGTFLLASERELRKQRRESEDFRRKQTDNPLAPAELMTRNKELVEKISSLSSRLEETQRHLAGMEHASEALRLENCRLEEEISQSQERFARSEEDQREVSALRQQIEELQTKQAAVQSATMTAVESSSESVESAVIHRVERIPFEMAVSEADSPINGLGESSGNDSDHGSDEAAGAILVATENEVKPAGRTSGKWNWRLGMIPAVVVLAIVVGFLSTSSDSFFGSKEPAGTPGTGFEEQWTPSEAASDALGRLGPATVSPPVASESHKQTAATKPARLRGAFKITRPTQVYSRPSETSPLIAKLGPGMKINVVGSRDGWLEIRSKHGRPPGFVRHEAAVRID